MKVQVRISEDICDGCMHVGNLTNCMAEDLPCFEYTRDGSEVYYIIKDITNQEEQTNETN